MKHELSSIKNNSTSDIKEKSTTTGLKRPPMQLYLYKIILKYKSEPTRSIPHIDLGFSVSVEDKETLSKFKIGSVIESFKDDRTYSYKQTANNKQLYTYKAYLERVIDADTLLVNIDLGFSTSIEQRLRLRGLDAPELLTKQGIASKKFVESSLKDCRFLIIKTYGKDKYDRYLVDVFYIKNEDDEQKVLKEGIFLNKELLEHHQAVLN